MKKLYYLNCLLLVVALSCHSGENDSKAKEPEAQIAQAVSSDTVVTLYNSQRPYKLHQRINTQVKFVRSLKDSVGRFYLDEKYLNKKDSMVHHYEGAGNYKIFPKPNGDIQGVAIYDMVMDDKSKGYLYLLKDSVTMVRVDDQWHEMTGDDAVVLKSDNKY